MSSIDAERLAEIKRQPWTHVTLAALEPDTDAPFRPRWEAAYGDEETRAAIDKYLFGFVLSAGCPGCGSGMFGWGIAWGAGDCSCGWPGRIYHEIRDRREIDHLVCTARCNGYDVCHATRGEHVETPIQWFGVESGEKTTTIELRCPDPTPPPGIRSPFTSEWKPPIVLEFTGLLWAHPYGIHIKTPAKVPA